MLYTPSHAELAQHPKTRKLARLLGVAIPTAIGHLHLLWHFALKYAPDGDLGSFEWDEVADGVLWEGEPDAFCQACIAAGWLEVRDPDNEDQDLVIHDWQDYGGKAIKQKEENAERQQRWRDRHKTDTSQPPNDPVTVTSPLHNALDKIRGEKSKEEEKIPTPLTPPAAKPTPPPVAPPLGGVSARRAPKATNLNARQQPRFDRWYPTYPNKQHRPEAERAFAKLDPDDDLTDRLIADTAQRQRGRKWAEGYIEHPATYLTNRVWEDDIEPVRLAPSARAPDLQVVNGVAMSPRMARNVRVAQETEL